MGGLEAVGRGHADGAMGIAMTIEDSWGGDVVTARLALSTPPDLPCSATGFNSYVSRNIAPDAPRRPAGRLVASDRSELGLSPDAARLEAPALVLGAAPQRGPPLGGRGRRAMSGK